jgi:hypothetical protein
MATSVKFYRLNFMKNYHGNFTNANGYLPLVWQTWGRSTPARYGVCVSIANIPLEKAMKKIAASVLIAMAGLIVAAPASADYYYHHHCHRVWHHHHWERVCR